MRALSTLPAHAWADVAGVFTDVEDTLTTEGAVTPDALQALHDLAHAGSAAALIADARQVLPESVLK